MKKYLYFIAVIGGLLLTSNAYAQLPANPWAPKPPTPNNGDFGPNVPEKGWAQAPNAPIYENGVTNGEVLPVDPWATARDRTGIETWRRSGRHGSLNYVGEAVSWGDSSGGGERVAPEVNRHNMVVMLDHLRKMGYKIPASYDQKVRDLPNAYRQKLRKSYDDIPNATDPFGQGFYRIMRNVEDGTGLDFENLMFNSIDLLGTD